MSRYASAVPSSFYDKPKRSNFDLYDEENDIWVPTKKPEVTIVRGVAIDGMDFHTKLDEPTKKEFDLITEVWHKSSKTPELLDRLKCLLSTSENPFVLSLQLFTVADQFPKTDSLSFAVLEATKAFKITLERSFIEDRLTLNTKMVGFNLMKSKNRASIQLVAEVFELVKAKHLFVETIKKLAEQRYLKEAANLAIDLDLCAEFQFMDILALLFLDDKIGIFEEYFAKAGTNLKLTTVEYLDNLLEKPADIFENCKPLIDQYFIRNAKQDKLSAKSVHQLIDRLTRKNRINPNKAPNNEYFRESKQLSFVIKHFYEAKKSSRQTFEENIRAQLNIKHNIRLQIQLLQQCLDFGEHKDAVMFAKQFDVQKRLMPQEIVEFLANGIPENKEKVQITFKSHAKFCDDDGWTDSEKAIFDEGKAEEFYELSLGRDKIVIVDSAEKYEKMFIAIESTGTVAFDSEFTTRGTAAILQLAIDDAAFIVDLLGLKMIGEKWKMIGDRVFNNEKITKLGFAYREDIKVLQKTRALNIQPKSYATYIDLMDTNKKHFPFPQYRGISQTLSLSTVTKMCFRKSLNKGEQLSNWSQRPLREAQIIYAALDAYVLLEINRVLVESSEAQRI